MKGTDRAILSLLLAVGLLAAFYLMVLSPKREEASKLSEEITALKSAISEQEQVAAFAEEARRGLPHLLRPLVVLGKAVPEQADSASLLVQLNSIANGTGVDFRAIKLSDGGGAVGSAGAGDLDRSIDDRHLRRRGRADRRRAVGHRRSSARDRARRPPRCRSGPRLAPPDCRRSHMSSASTVASSTSRTSSPESTASSSYAPNQGRSRPTAGC